MKIRAPFRVSWMDEPRYGRFFFLEAFGIVRTLMLARNSIVSADPPVARVIEKQFRWDYRVIANILHREPRGITTGVPN